MGEDLEVTSEMVDIRVNSKEGYDAAYLNDNFIVIDTKLTEDLILEGVAREIVSKVQNLRKESNFDVENRINLYYDGDLDDVLAKYSDYIKKETLSIDIVKTTSSTDNNNGNEDVIPPIEEDKEEQKPNEPVIIYPTPEETITNSGYKITSDKYMTNFTLGSTVQGTIDKLQKANQYASINITNSSNKAKTSGSLVTGDKITIISNDNIKTYTVIIYGDNNGDGEITTLDLLRIQKHILKKSTLTSEFLKSADVDKNGTVSTLDLLKVQKHILKISNISQS